MLYGTLLRKYSKHKMKITPQPRTIQTHHLLVSRRLPSPSHSETQLKAALKKKKLYDKIHIMIKKYIYIPGA